MIRKEWEIIMTLMAHGQLGHYDGIQIRVSGLFSDLDFFGLT